MLPNIPLQTYAGNGALAFLASMFAGWGVTSANLPDFVMWEVLAIVGAGFYMKFSGIASWKKFFTILAVTLLSAAMLYDTDWANTWLFSNLPIPANAGMVGVASAMAMTHAKELTEAIISRIKKGK